MTLINASRFNQQLRQHMGDQLLFKRDDVEGVHR